MADQILSWVVLSLPILFAAVVEIVSEEVKGRIAWRIIVGAFGLGLSALIWIQMSRGVRSARSEQQSAIEETASKVSGSVSESVSNTLSGQYAQTINGLQGQITTLQAQLSAQGKNVEAIKQNKLLNATEPIKVQVTNQPSGTTESNPVVRFSQMSVTPMPNLGKNATQYILTTDRVMNGAKALFHCENKINNGSATISGASTLMKASAMVDDHTFKAWIGAPNWAPSSPFVVTLYYDEDNIGTCHITLLE